MSLKKVLGFRSVRNHIKQKLTPYFDRTFLAAGNAPAYQSVADGACCGLPALGNSLRKSIFSSQLSLPQPLDPWSPQVSLTSVLYPQKNVWNTGVSSLHFHLASILQGLYIMTLGGLWLSFTHSHREPWGLLRAAVIISGQGLFCRLPWDDWSQQPRYSQLSGKTTKQNPKGSAFSC